MSSLHINISRSGDPVALFSKADAVKNRWPAYTYMVDWLTGLMVDVIDVERNLSVQELKFDNSDISSGRPLFHPENIPVDIDLAIKLFARLAAKVAAHQGGKGKGITGLFSESDREARDTVRAVLKSDMKRIRAVCKPCNVDPQIVVLVLKLCLGPSLRHVAKEVSSKIVFKWKNGYCPVCGSSPGLGELTQENGTRRLHCSLCETSWPYPRMQCPFCENRDQKRLIYLYAYGEDGLRVDLCKKCGHGLKTIDLRHAPAPIIPLIDDLIISHLIPFSSQADQPLRYT